MHDFCILYYFASLCSECYYLVMAIHTFCSFSFHSVVTCILYECYWRKFLWQNFKAISDSLFYIKSIFLTMTGNFLLNTFKSILIKGFDQTDTVLLMDCFY